MKKLTEVSENFKVNTQNKIENMGFITEAVTDGIMAEFKVVAKRDGESDNVDVQLIVNNKVVATKRISKQEAGSGTDVYSRAHDAVEKLLK